MAYIYNIYNMKYIYTQNKQIHDKKDWYIYINENCGESGGITKNIGENTAKNRCNYSSHHFPPETIARVWPPTIARGWHPPLLRGGGGLVETAEHSRFFWLITLFLLVVNFIAFRCILSGGLCYGGWYCYGCRHGHL